MEVRIFLLRHLQNLVHGRGSVLAARDLPLHGQRGRCPSRVLQVSLLFDLLLKRYGYMILFTATERFQEQKRE